VERAALCDLGGESMEKPDPHVGAMLDLELVPLLGLGRIDEVEDQSGVEADLAVVVVG
jgi:hypothetical protein